MGTEIYTKRFFPREHGLEIKVRARLGKHPPGLVSGIFTYITDSEGATNEIDVEFLSNKTFIAKKRLLIMLSTWRNWDEARNGMGDASSHWSTQITLPGLDPSDWHDYVIRWLPDRTEWFVDRKRVAISMQAQPEQPTKIHFNLWAPSASWALAYAKSLIPSSHPRANQSYFIDLDWVEVSRL